MKYLSHYTQEARTQLLDKCGAFFAFNLTQYEEKANPDKEYISCGNGLVCEKKHVEELIIGLQNTLIEGIKADVKENGAKKIIRREYFNYESQISGDYDDARNALKAYQEIFPKKFNQERIEREFQECWKIAVEEDLF